MGKPKGLREGLSPWKGPKQCFLGRVGRKPKKSSETVKFSMDYGKARKAQQKRKEPLSQPLPSISRPGLHEIAGRLWQVLRHARDGRRGRPPGRQTPPPQMKCVTAWRGTATNVDPETDSRLQARVSKRSRLIMRCSSSFVSSGFPGYAETTRAPHPSIVT